MRQVGPITGGGADIGGGGGLLSITIIIITGHTGRRIRETGFGVRGGVPPLA